MVTASGMPSRLMPRWRSESRSRLGFLLNPVQKFLFDLIEFDLLRVGIDQILQRMRPQRQRHAVLQQIGDLRLRGILLPPDRLKYFTALEIRQVA